MGTWRRSKCHSLPSDAPPNKRTPRHHPFLSAQWFKGKIKVLNSTKVAVRSRKELERKMAIEIFIILSHKWPCWTPASLSVRDSPSYPVGSQPLLSHQMVAVSMAHGKFLVSRTSREKGWGGGAQCSSGVSESFGALVPAILIQQVLDGTRKQPNKHPRCF